MTRTYPDLNIADENDTVIGQMQLYDAMAAGQNLQVSHVMLMNRAGEILLQQRSKHVFLPLLWNAAAAGHVDAGDDYVRTAQKELEEEMGVRLPMTAFAEFDSVYLRETHNGADYGKFHHSFVAEYSGDIRPDGHEVADYRWVSPSQLARELSEKPELFTQVFVHLANKYLKNIASR